jgi:glycine cleavage system H protein
MGKKPKSKPPRDAKFSETHEWIRVDGSEAVVGISDYAVGRLGQLVSLDLPAIGASVSREKAMGELESVKTVAELIAPVSGKVVAVNAKVQDHLDLMADSPYEDGWLIRVKMKDPQEAGRLMSSKQYLDYLESQVEEEGEEDELDAEEVDEAEDAEEDEEDDDEGF